MKQVLGLVLGFFLILSSSAGAHTPVADSSRTSYRADFVSDVLKGAGSDLADEFECSSDCDGQNLAELAHDDSWSHWLNHHALTSDGLITSFLVGSAGYLAWKRCHGLGFRGTASAAMTGLVTLFGWYSSADRGTKQAICSATGGVVCDRCHGGQCGAHGHG